MKVTHLNKFLQKKVGIKPPAELGPHGRAQWKKMTAQYSFEDEGGRATLLALCRAEDDVMAMRAIVREEGLQIPGKVVTTPTGTRTEFGRVAHPMLNAISKAESLKRLLLRQLNLATGPTEGK